MRKTEVRTESVETFFERGRRGAALADRGERIPPSRVIAFEDVEELLGLLSGRRVSLLREVKGAPGSITDLARRLGRDRSAVTRDVALLERYGVIRVVEKPLPGHGKQKWVTPVAAAVELSARL